MIISTLFGPEKKKKVCNTCGEEKEIEEFHNLPYKKYRNDERKRNQCKKCWDKYNGRSNFANVTTFEVK